jgi:septum formation protein
MKIVLASASPRRRDILTLAGLRGFEIHPAGGEEILPPGIAPGAAVEKLSYQKCAEVAALYDSETVVIASDTVVAIDGMILGKPADAAEAAGRCAPLRPDPPGSIGVPWPAVGRPWWSRGDCRHFRR